MSRPTTKWTTVPIKPVVGPITSGTFQASNYASLEIKFAYIDEYSLDAQLGWNSPAGEFGPWLWNVKALRDAAEFLNESANKVDEIQKQAKADRDAGKRGGC